jgi:NAD(P)H-nitrite reductase large subunit
MTRYAIIGTGVAGVAAIDTLRRNDPGAEIFVITEDPHGFYSRPGLAYYLSDEIPKSRLTLYSRQDWKALNIRFVQAPVTGLDPRNHRVMVHKLGALPYHRLLLATGSRAVPLNVPGANAKGVVKLDTYEDANHILSLARHVRSAVVVGGGIISVELVEGLVARGVKVHYFIRGDRYWSNVLDEAESRIIEERLKEDGILIHYHTETAEILQRGGKVRAVKTKNGEVIPCGLVAVGIGVKPRIELAQAAGLQVDRGILVNEYLQTSDPDIYAAGDAAQAMDPLTGTALVDTLWMPARKQGWTAALNMAGKRQAYARTTAINVLRLAGVMITIVGAVGSGHDDDIVSMARGSSETWLQLPNTIAMVTGDKLNHLRVMVGERTLLGALLLGDQKLSFPLQDLITHQVDITPIREQMLGSQDQLGHILMDYWTSTRRAS